MSFVDLMANDIWSEADIVRRTEAIIHAEFPVEAELILNRKVTGQVLGAYQLTAEEGVQLGAYSVLSAKARVQGDQARADMALLAKVFPLEVAHRRLAHPEVFPTPTPKAPLKPLTEAEVAASQALVGKDQAERAAAKAVMDGAATNVKALFLLRNPPPPETVITPLVAA